MKIYTKKGDTGYTSLRHGRVPKNHLTIRLLGLIDDLQSSLGFLIYHCQDHNQSFLETIQKNLMSIMSLVSGYKVNIDLETNLTDLENQIDIKHKALPRLSNFILSGFGTNEKELYAHQARTKCRLVESHLNDEVSPIIRKWINRLSDYLFTLCREYNTNEKAFSIKKQSIV